MQIFRLLVLGTSGIEQNMNFAGYVQGDGLMAYEICKRCGKMFEKSGEIYCRDCFEKTRREYEIIIRYIRKYPDAIVLDIIAETGVSFKGINCLVEDGSFTYVENKLITKNVEENLEQTSKRSTKSGKFHFRR